MTRRKFRVIIAKMKSQIALILRNFVNCSIYKSERAPQLNLLRVNVKEKENM